MAPEDIPRLILNYDNYSVQFSKNRFDIFLNDVELAKEKILVISQILSDRFEINFGRIGFVKTFFSSNTDYPRGLIIPEKIEGLKISELNIRINIEKKFLDFNCNDIQSVANGKVTKDVEKITKNGLIITRDINTMNDDLMKNVFTKEQVIELLGLFDLEADKLIV